MLTQNVGNEEIEDFRIDHKWKEGFRDSKRLIVAKCLKHFLGEHALE